MASQDLHNQLKLTPALLAQSITSNTTTAGVTVDTQGFESVEFAIQSATLTDGAYAVAVYAGDASNMSDEALVDTDAKGLIGSSSLSFALTDDNVTKKVGYKGPKRYARVKIVSTAVTSGGALAGVAILGHARVLPVA